MGKDIETDSEGKVKEANMFLPNIRGFRYDSMTQRHLDAMTHRLSDALTHFGTEGGVKEGKGGQRLPGQCTENINVPRDSALVIAAHQI